MIYKIIALLSFVCFLILNYLIGAEPKYHTLFMLILSAVAFALSLFKIGTQK